MLAQSASFYLRTFIIEHHFSFSIAKYACRHALLQRYRRHSPIYFSDTSKKRNLSTITPKNVLQLHQRGIFKDIYPEAAVGLPEVLSKKQCFYCGFDPTVDSLHVGNLLSIMALLHCQRSGTLCYNIDVSCENNLFA